MVVMSVLCACHATYSDCSCWDMSGRLSPSIDTCVYLTFVASEHFKNSRGGYRVPPYILLDLQKFVIAPPRTFLN